MLEKQPPRPGTLCRRGWSPRCSSTGRTGGRPVSAGTVRLTGNINFSYGILQENVFGKNEITNRIPNPQSGYKILEYLS